MQNRGGQKSVSGRWNRRAPRRAGTFVFMVLAACGSASGQEGEVAATEAPREAPDARATRVEAAVVRPSSARIQTEIPGEVEGSRDALLASALGGFIERVSVQKGESVRNGQVLVRVDSALHGARLAQARVELEAAERELARAQRLSGAISQAQIDGARTRVDAANAALRVAQVTAGRTTIKAPFAGVVADVEAETGEVAAPGAPLVRIVNVDTVHVSLAVPDRDVVALRQGMEVRVRIRATGATRAGTIVHISPAANIQTRSFEVDVEVDNQDRTLLPGMIAQVEIATAAGADRVVLPQYALVTRLDGNGVFVVNGDRAQWRPVQTGSVVRDQVVVESGIQTGDRVIFTGHRELADGDRIMVVREGMCCTDGRVQYGDLEPAVAGDRADP